MASDLNEVMILGNLGDAPEIREFGDGKKVCNLSVATNKNYKDRNGEWVEDTTWHRVSVFDQKMIEWLERDAVKGTRVLLRGELRTRSYETKDGDKKYVTEIVLQPFVSMLKFQGKTKSENATQVVKEEVTEDEIPF